MVHGAEGPAAAKRITQSLFSGALHDMTEADSRSAGAGRHADHQTRWRRRSAAGVGECRTGAVTRPRTMIGSNAVTINGEKQSDAEYRFSDSDRLAATRRRAAARNTTARDWQ